MSLCSSIKSLGETDGVCTLNAPYWREASMLVLCILIRAAQFSVFRNWDHHRRGLPVFFFLFLKAESWKM